MRLPGLTWLGSGLGLGLELGLGLGLGLDLASRLALELAGLGLGLESVGGVRLRVRADLLDAEAELGAAARRLGL